jgi:imidazolonepropionase
LNLALLDIAQLVTVPSHGKRLKRGPEMSDLGVIENGAVIIEGDTIAWCGKMEDLSMARVKEASVLDCLNRVVMPGFVDAHTHLVFAGSREEEFAMRARGVTYQEIAERGGGIVSTMGHVRASTKKELKKNARRWLYGLLQHGTTTVEIKSGYGLDMDSEIRMLEAINELNAEEVITIVATFLGAHALPPEFGKMKAEYVREVVERMIPYIGSKRLAAFCDVFCEKGYFSVAESKLILNQGKHFNMAPKIHAEELNFTGGAELAVAVGAASADHLEHVSDAGIAALSESETVGVLLPGVSFFLSNPYAPARKLIDSGAAVAIASDFNPGSCMSYNMQMMMTIACTQMKMTPEEAITAATLNGAAALKMSGQVGSIEPGKKADLCVLNVPNYSWIPYHFGVNHVEKVVKNGVVLEF